MNRIAILSLIFILPLLLNGCDSEPIDQPYEGGEQTSDDDQQAATESTDDEPSLSVTEQLDELYAEHNQAMLELNPVIATFRGIPGHNDRWANSIGNEYRERDRQLQRSFLERVQALGQNAYQAGELTGQNLLNYEIFVRDRELQLRGMQFPGHLMPVNQFRNPTNFYAQLGSGQNAQPFNNEQDYRNFIARSEDFAVYIEQAIVNMRAGMEQGLTQPRILMERVLPQLEAHMVDNVQDSLFYTPLNNLPDSIPEAARPELINDYSDMISNVLIPAITRLHHFIDNEYLDAARESSGMTALPGGDEWYAFLVEVSTSTDLTPEQIHQIGLSEVARIHHEMREVMEQVSFEGDLQDFFEFTANDPQFVFDTREDLLNAFRALEAPLDEAAENLFSIRPKADFEIRAVEEYRERSASSGSYQRPAPDGSRPGIFYANTYDLSARPSWTVTSLYLHEAVPGHHFQLALQQELEGLPDFRRYGGTTAYTEGWGLYAESLGKEMGIYEDRPYQYFGGLVAELWRAIRLVVDTGLHYKGWSREQVLDYMYANAPVAEARAVSEAERFMAIPGQALAYKIGQLKIRELRTRAEQTLGEQFDVRDFHSQVLTSGSLPLNILEAKIDRWIAVQQ